MKTDSNKGITAIDYNHLNLPRSVSLGGGTITYIYDATGVKQRKVAGTTTTDYAGNYMYKNNVLQFFNHPEGYVENISGTYKYHYYHKDHLGNIRLSYFNNGTAASPSVVISEENNYYPFGLRHKGYNDAPNGYGNSAAKMFKFGGKEFQDEIIGGKSLDWYDISARNYDPALGRWMNVDPLAETTMQPYSAFNNNPMNFIDPDGRMAVPPGDYYDTDGNYLGNDGIDDNKVYSVEGTSKFNVSDFGEGGKYHNNETAYNENNGNGFSVTYEGQVSDVFVTGDTPSDKRIQSLHPAIRMKATNFIKEANASSENTLIRVAQGYRTFAEQDALYAKGRTAGGSIVTNARGGYSNHNFGLAFDIVGITNGKIDYNIDWSGLSTLGKSQGFEWGGNWKFTDKPHFQNMFGNSVKSLREKYNSGSLINGYIKF